MAYSSKSAFILVSLVLSIYMMRNTDLSPGSVFSHALRSLANLESTVSFCADVDINASFSDQQINQAKAAIDSVKTLRGGNKLFEFLNSGEQDKMEYIKPLIPVIVPWAVMLIISLLCCFSLYCNWCYLHGCCKNNRICSCCKAPKHQTKMKLFVTLSSIFLVLTLGASIAGLVFSRQVAPGIRRTYCSAIALGGDMVYGVSDKQWIGLQPAIDSIDSLLADISDTIDNLNLVTNPAVNTKCQEGKDKIADFIAEFENEVVPRAAADKISQNYAPQYIANIGPADDNTTYAGMIQAEFQLYNNTVVGGQATVAYSVNDIKSNKADIEETLQTGRSTAVQINDSVEDVLSDAVDNQDRVESAITGLNIGLLVFFLVFLVLSVFSVIGIILVVKFRVRIFSKFLHLSWCLFIVLTLLGFILCGVLYTASLAIAEGCDTATVLLSDEAFYERVKTTYLTDPDIALAADTMQMCLFQGTSGESILTKFGLDTSLVSFGTIYVALRAVNGVIPIDTSSPPSSMAITTQQSAVTLLRDGKLLDSTVIGEDLAALNSATTADCADLKDTWQLNSANCTTSQGTAFASGDPTTAYRPQATCIGFDAWGSSNTIGNRYASPFFSSCSNIGSKSALDYAKESVDGFVDNREKVSELFDKVLTQGTADLESINTIFGQFMTAIVNVLNALKNVEDELQTIEAALIGPTTGLIPNSKCYFAQASVQLVVDSMCVEFFSGLFFTSVLLILMSIMSLFSAMWLFVLLKRVNLPKYEMAKTTSPAV